MKYAHMLSLLKKITQTQINNRIGQEIVRKLLGELTWHNPDRRSWAAGEFIGKDVFLKSFTQQAGNTCPSTIRNDLVSNVQNLNMSVLKIGDFTADSLASSCKHDLRRCR